MQPFSNFQYNFRSSQLPADLLKVVFVFDRAARAFIKSGPTGAVALD